MSALQLDFFDDNSDIGLVRRDISELRKRNDSLRKGMFFRHHELEKTVFELKEEINNLKNLIIEARKV